MRLSRVLITGGSGLLALNWACCMRASHEVILARHSRKITLDGVSVVSLDLESDATLTKQLEIVRPSLVVHTAGLTSVDLCEQQPAAAMHANAELARNVALATRRLNIKLIHISTDHLFSGSRSRYTETDPPAPLNVYGRTKLQAEQWVTQENPEALLVRTNFFGWGHRYRQSFSDWIICSLRGGLARSTLVAARPLDMSLANTRARSSAGTSALWTAFYCGCSSRSPLAGGTSFGTR